MSGRGRASTLPAWMTSAPGSAPPGAFPAPPAADAPRPRGRRARRRRGVDRTRRSRRPTQVLAQRGDRASPRTRNRLLDDPHRARGRHDPVEGGFRRGRARLLPFSTRRRPDGPSRTSRARRARRRLPSPRRAPPPRKPPSRNAAKSASKSASKSTSKSTSLPSPVGASPPSRRTPKAAFARARRRRRVRDRHVARRQPRDRERPPRRAQDGGRETSVSARVPGASQQGGARRAQRRRESREGRLRGDASRTRRRTARSTGFEPTTSGRRRARILVSGTSRTPIRTDARFVDDREKLGDREKICSASAAVGERKQDDERRGRRVARESPRRERLPRTPPRTRRRRERSVERNERHLRGRSAIDEVRRGGSFGGVRAVVTPPDCATRRTRSRPPRWRPATTPSNESIASCSWRFWIRNVATVRWRFVFHGACSWRRSSRTSPRTNTRRETARGRAPRELYEDAQEEMERDAEADRHAVEAAARECGVVIDRHTDANAPAPRSTRRPPTASSETIDSPKRIERIDAGAKKCDATSKKSKKSSKKSRGGGSTGSTSRAATRSRRRRRRRDARRGGNDARWRISSAAGRVEARVEVEDDVGRRRATIARRAGVAQMLRRRGRSADEYLEDAKALFAARAGRLAAREAEARAAMEEGEALPDEDEDDGAGLGERGRATPPTTTRTVRVRVEVAVEAKTTTTTAREDAGANEPDGAARGERRAA